MANSINNGGVFIEDISGKLWAIEDWDDSAKPNSIVVISHRHSFRMALIDSVSMMKMHGECTDSWDSSLLCVGKKKAEALSDYGGKLNTERIMKLQPSKKYAAGWCNAYIFPDGVTKGYLPSLGELLLAGQNYAAVNAALTKCGGVVMDCETLYLSSTYYMVYYGYCIFWGIIPYSCYVYTDGIKGKNQIRPFAPFEKQNFI